MADALTGPLPVNMPDSGDVPYCHVNYEAPSITMAYHTADNFMLCEQVSQEAMCSITPCNNEVPSGSISRSFPTSHNQMPPPPYDGFSMDDATCATNPPDINLVIPELNDLPQCSVTSSQSSSSPTQDTLPDLIPSNTLPPYIPDSPQSAILFSERSLHRSALPSPTVHSRSRHGGLMGQHLCGAFNNCCRSSKCVKCMTKVTTLRYFLLMLTIVGVVGIVSGIVLGALQMAYHSGFLAISLSFIALGVSIVTISAVVWKCNPSHYEPFHWLCCLGQYENRCRRSSSRSRSRSRNQASLWHGGILYSEFNFRRPPPSYQESMEQYRQQRLNMSLTPPSTPPPTYRSNASSVDCARRRITYPVLLDGSYPESHPPTYRSQGSINTRPQISQAVFHVDGEINSGYTAAHSENSSTEVIHHRVEVHCNEHGANVLGHGANVYGTAADIGNYTDAHVQVCEGSTELQSLQNNGASRPDQAIVVSINEMEDMVIEYIDSLLACHMEEDIESLIDSKQSDNTSAADTVLEHHNTLHDSVAMVMLPPPQSVVENNSGDTTYPCKTSVVSLDLCQDEGSACAALASDRVPSVDLTVSSLSVSISDLPGAKSASQQRLQIRNKDSSVQSVVGYRGNFGATL